jgi:hypothetical protein
LRARFQPRKAGGLLNRLEKNRGGDRKSTLQPAKLISPYREALEEAEIEDTEAARWQQVAAIPEEKFFAYSFGVSGSSRSREFLPSWT